MKASIPQNWQPVSFRTGCRTVASSPAHRARLGGSYAGGLAGIQDVDDIPVNDTDHLAGEGVGREGRGQEEGEEERGKLERARGHGLSGAVLRGFYEG